MDRSSWNGLIDTCSSGGEVRVRNDGDRCVVEYGNGIQLDASIDTPFRCHEEDSMNDTHYSLLSIVLLYNLRSNTDHDVYINAAFDQAVDVPVSFLDRDTILDVLLGGLGEEKRVELIDYSMLQEEDVGGLMDVDRNETEKMTSIDHEYVAERGIEMIERAEISKNELLTDPTKDYQFALGLLSSSKDSRIKDKKDKSREKSEKLGVPILLIPNSSASLVSLENIQSLLGQGRFVRLDSNNGTSTGRTVVKIKKTSILNPKKTAVFHVMNDPTLLSREDWSRVIGVIVSGQKWQFKGFRLGTEDPVDVLCRIPGFHFKYREDDLNTNVSQWNVKILEIGRSHRHYDQGAVMEFWNLLCQGLSSRNKRVFY